MGIDTESRNALRELLDLIAEVDERWAGPEWNLASADDVVGAHRALLHLLEGGLVGAFESDPDQPEFRRIVTPWRKLTGDNPDAIYYDAPVRPERRYVVRGSMDGAVYVSITVEVGAGDGSMATRTAGVLNDTAFDVDDRGRFEIHLGGAPRERNWLPLEAGASRITTRHYWEERLPAAADPRRNPALRIEVVGGAPPSPPPDDARVAAGIRRVGRFLRSRTLEQPPMVSRQPPRFVSLVPNVFPAPVPPGDLGLAAADAAYSMAPYLIGPDQALVMHARWPACRCANVSLWTRHMQTYDYAHRPVSLNRVQTRLESDGSFRAVLAHRDPGVPNWLDTEGRAFGLVFWRFFLPEGEIETPRAELVPLDSL
ncbi:MAG: DUF1214 domain-containing protein [Deltaproteobacteria bacterium]|nr:MAG: DUF1214 domain-containing protein [Deltaproteobacteria bacterium]